jgi:hypothetical protein
MAIGAGIGDGADFGASTDATDGAALRPGGAHPGGGTKALLESAGCTGPVTGAGGGAIA